MSASNSATTDLALTKTPNRTETESPISGPVVEAVVPNQDAVPWGFLKPSSDRPGYGGQLDSYPAVMEPLTV